MRARCKQLDLDAVDLSDIARSDIARWIVLRRAAQNRLMLDRLGGDCFDGGRLLARHLRPTVTLLLDELHLMVAERAHEVGGISLNLGLTDEGKRRLVELTEERARESASSPTRLVDARPSKSGCAHQHRSGDAMFMQWLAVALVAIVTILRIIANHYNRPIADRDTARRWGSR